MTIKVLFNFHTKINLKKKKNYAIKIHPKEISTNFPNNKLHFILTLYVSYKFTKRFGVTDHHTD